MELAELDKVVRGIGNGLIKAADLYGGKDSQAGQQTSGEDRSVQPAGGTRPTFTLRLPLDGANRTMNAHDWPRPEEEWPRSQRDLDNYLRLLESVEWRIRRASDLLAENDDAEIERLEYAALHLRMTLELIVVGSIIANRPETDAVLAALLANKIGKARRLVKAANPHYWPRPLYQDRDENGGQKLVPIKDGFLTESDWGRAWHFTSGIMHALPIQQRSQSETQARLLSITDRVHRLMQFHAMVLTGTSAHHQVWGVLGTLRPDGAAVWLASSADNAKDGP